MFEIGNFIAGAVVMPFEKKAYQFKNKDYLKPLLLTSSGGGGHITAITGIHSFLAQSVKTINIPLYNPVLFVEKPASVLRTRVWFGVKILHTPIIGFLMQFLLRWTPFPCLPDKRTLQNDIDALSLKEKDRQRPYVDMLLDVYPSGYEYAAIWNIFQRNDNTSDLKKLVALQKHSDRENEEVVKVYFLNQLQQAANNKAAYTEIISTQPIGLRGLCNAVLAYNHWLHNQPHLQASPILIHQYMTDLPTKGAVHFFNALASLEREQQEIINLYALGISKEIIDYFFPNGAFFKGIFDLPVNENPMVRPELKNIQMDNSSNFYKPVRIALSGKAQACWLNGGEVVASILLGSQVGKDSIAYIKILLEKGVDKVFIFGGQNQNIQAGIVKMLSDCPDYKEKIISLGYQSDAALTALMTRSNIVVIRGGGLCVMEQLALNHNKEQLVLVHHANGVKGELTSGISWEDDNVDALIAHLRARGVHALKTNPAKAVHDLAQMRWVQGNLKEECTM